MKTMVNGKDAEWTPEIWALWDATTEGRPGGKVLMSNYFTPRPYVDEYNRGSKTTGFTYTVQAEGSAGIPSVWQVLI